MDAASEEEQSLRNMTLRIMTINFGAIHTSSMSFTHALYDLAAMPNYIQPMREEVETVVKKEGWSKVALTKMRKLDSFLKESQRFNGLGCSESICDIYHCQLNYLFSFFDSESGERLHLCRRYIHPQRHQCHSCIASHPS